jgi:hypothetical protein
LEAPRKAKMNVEEKCIDTVSDLSLCPVAGRNQLEISATVRSRGIVLSTAQYCFSVLFVITVSLIRLSRGLKRHQFSLRPTSAFSIPPVSGCPLHNSLQNSPSPVFPFIIELRFIIHANYHHSPFITTITVTIQHNQAGRGNNPSQWAW